MTRRLPLVIVLVSLALFGVTVWFAATGRGGCLPEWTPTGSEAAHECVAMRATADVAAPWEKVSISGLGFAFVLLGSFLLTRAKGNRYGLVFCVEGFLFVLTGFGEGYTMHGLVETSLPLVTPVAVATELTGGPIIFLPFAFFFLLYPTGSLPSPRWKPVVWGAIVSGTLLLVTSTLGSSHLRLARLHENPIHVEAVEGAREAVEIVALLIFLGCLLASIGSLVLRFRRSHGVERLQIRWFAAAAAFVAITVMCGPIFWANPSLEFLWGPLFIASMASLPVAASVAILRYKLWEIDLIINKALVYALLTGVLASLYLGLVFVLQSLLPLQTDSDLAIAASTLAAAALFRPLRARIQAFIDRRFYRRRYDASKALGRLNQRLRDEVDLETVERDVLTVVGSTVQPTHASLWLREVT